MIAESVIEVKGDVFVFLTPIINYTALPPLLNLVVSFYNRRIAIYITKNLTNYVIL